jgi:hypothetical protein
VDGRDSGAEVNDGEGSAQRQLYKEGMHELYDGRNFVLAYNNLKR